MKLISKSLIFFLILVGCNKKRVFEEHKSFEKQPWNSDSGIVFKHTIKDTITKNQIEIKLRHTVDYEFQNIFLFIKAEKQDTVEIKLANKEGRWLGRGVGNIRSIDFLYKKHKRFFKKGVLSIEVQQAMRYGKLEKIQNLKHIESIGICIEKEND